MTSQQNILTATVDGSRQAERVVAFLLHVCMFLVLVLLLSFAGCKGSRTPRPTIGQLAQQSFIASAESHMAASEQAVNESASQFGLSTIATPAGARSLPMVQPAGFLMDAESTSSAEIVEPILLDGDFIETPLRDALTDLAADAEVQLVLDDDVLGVVNLQFQEKNIDEAFELILSAQAFYHNRVENTIYVGPADAKSPVFPLISQRVEYRPKFVESKSLLDSVPSSYREFVTHVEGARSLLIEAPQRVALRIIQRFEAIDTPVAQVALEAIICVIAPDEGKRVGLNWQHAVELNGKEALRFGVSGLALGINVSNDGVDAAFSDFSQTTAFVNALSENGYLTIRATPHIVAQDGKKASIMINRETFFSMQPQTSGSGDSNAFFIQQNIERVEAGITFDITPHVRGDLVTMIIDRIEVSEDIRTANADTALNPFPIINRRSVSTTASVNDGRTVVLGGLMQRETVDRTNSIPILGDLPLFGHLFKTTQRQERDVEVVIFLSPKIINPEQIIAGTNY